MTLHEFEKRMKTICPDFKLKKRGDANIVGLYFGTEYLFRVNKGELNMLGWKNHTPGIAVPMSRGRHTVVQILTKWHKIKYSDRSYLLYGYKNS